MSRETCFSLWRCIVRRLQSVASAVAVPASVTADSVMTADRLRAPMNNDESPHFIVPHEFIRP